MTDMPTTTVNFITREEWTARAKERGDFCNLTHDEQSQLAETLGVEVPKNLDDIGRMQWATRIQRCLENDWAIPGAKPEVGFGSSGMCMS